MICASKTTFSLNNIKSLWLKVKKNLANLCNSFCETPPGALYASKTFLCDKIQKSIFFLFLIFPSDFVVDNDVNESLKLNAI